MNIQNVVDQTGLTKRMIRHYEEVGLLNPRRSDNNYRSYSQSDIERLSNIKGLRLLGFALEDIKDILANKDVEEILRKHLQELLFKKREDYLEQQRSIDSLKRLLRADDATSALWNRIAHLNAVPKDTQDGLNELLARHKVIYGRIEELAKIAQSNLKFGPQKDFRIEVTEFMKFQELFETTKATGASVVSCDELYTHFVLLSSDPSCFTRDFHESVWVQFAKAWQEVSTVFAIHFETMTENIPGLENLFSWDDVAIRIEFRNNKNQEFVIAIPYAPLHAFLRRDKGVYLRE